MIKLSPCVVSYTMSGTSLGYNGLPWYVLVRKYVCTREDSLYACREYPQVEDGRRRLCVYNGREHVVVWDTAHNLRKFSKDVDDVRKMAWKEEGLQ